MLSKYTFLVLFTFSFHTIFSQVKIGQWMDHLSYDNANSVSKVDNIVYASNGAGLVTFDVSDNSIEKIGKIEGLSDVGVQFLRKNSYNNYLLVVYSNTNIDVIKPDGKIVNVSDIKRKIIQGKKVINEVYFKGKLAYIACGFGIVVFDTEKFEIKDTYYIGTATQNYEVNQVTSNDTAIFAATKNGIFFGKEINNLSFFQNWNSLNTNLASGPYNAIVNFKGSIITNYSQYSKTGAQAKDTLYELLNTGWNKYSVNSRYIGSTNLKLYEYSSQNALCILDLFGFAESSPTGQQLNYLTNYALDGSVPANISDVYYSSNSEFWVADSKLGLIKSGGSQFTLNERIRTNGPANNLVNDIDIIDGVLAVAPIYLGETYNSQFLAYKPSSYQNSEWSAMNFIPNSIGDFNAVAIDPKDKSHMAFACMSFGVLDVKDNQVTANYQYGNSPLVGINSGSDLRVTGVTYDKNSNLWVSITLGEKIIAVKKPNNSWTLLDFEQLVVQPTVTKIVFDKFDQAWIILARGYGLMVYKDGVGLSQPNSSNTKLLNNAVGNGNLPSQDVRALCNDKEGQMWIGTAKGISVVYNPENVFTNTNWDSQQIKIEQDGNVQLLLENDAITAIAVDGINRKWIGTESSGIYCFSSDGQQQIFHFTAENSPLYSNAIIDLVVDETTGDVFVGTEFGIQSYRTSIIKGYEDFTKVHAFPNPIKPGFTGNVVITGLIDESEIKITDVAGNLVFSTKAQGGQLEWNLKTFSGAKATTGTYLIHCATATGEKYSTAKLLIVN